MPESALGRSHPGCWTGTVYEHSCAVPSGRSCISCGAAAGTPWGPHYCPPCDVVRLDLISESLSDILRTTTKRESTQCP